MYNVYIYYTLILTDNRLGNVVITLKNFKSYQMIYFTVCKHFNNFWQLLHIFINNTRHYCKNYQKLYKCLAVCVTDLLHVECCNAKCHVTVKMIKHLKNV